MASFTIYTDGACQPNPGKGGWAAVILDGAHAKEISGGREHTTNNRMEILAAVEGIASTPRGSTVAVFSDSSYVVNGVEKGWAKRWQRHGWRRGKDGPSALNADLWADLLSLCQGRRVSFRWLRGHSGNRHNERADVLACHALLSPSLPADRGYLDQLASCTA